MQSSLTSEAAIECAAAHRLSIVLSRSARAPAAKWERLSRAAAARHRESLRSAAGILAGARTGPALLRAPARAASRLRSSRLTRSDRGPALPDRRLHLQPLPFRRNSATSGVGRAAPRIGQSAARPHRRAACGEMLEAALPPGPAAAARTGALPAPSDAAHSDSRRAGSGHAAGNHRRADGAGRRHSSRPPYERIEPAAGRRIRESA